MQQRADRSELGFQYLRKALARAVDGGLEEAELQLAREGREDQDVLVELLEVVQQRVDLLHPRRLEVRLRGCLLQVDYVPLATGALDPDLNGHQL